MIWLMLYNAVIVVLVTLFTISALLKLAALRDFIKLVIAYDVLPNRLARLYGFVLPFLELGGAVLLVFRTTVNSGALLLLVMLLAFGYAVFSVVKKGRRVRCACYGRFLEAEADHFTLGKTVLLIVLTLVVILFRDVSRTGFSIPSVMIGLYTTTLFMLAQNVWSKHKQAMRLLNR